MKQYDINIIKHYYITEKKYIAKIKSIYPNFFSDLSIIYSGSRLEQLNQYFLGIPKEKILCKVCKVKPVVFLYKRGFSDFCSFKCAQDSKNKMCKDIKKPNDFSFSDVIKSIGTKYTRIPYMIRNEFPFLIPELQNIKGKSISEKLYRLIYGDPKKCYCKNDVVFLDFRRGFQTFCSNKCMANSKTTQKNKENTMKERYGVTYGAQNSTIRKKFIISAFKEKTLVLPSGVSFSYQGFEDIAIIDLLKMGLKENDIISDISKMPEFWYEDGEKNRRYYPDLYIPKWNLIIEVKSKYTINSYESQKKSNLSGIESLKKKRQSVIDSGFNFNLFIRSKLDRKKFHYCLFTT